MSNERRSKQRITTSLPARWEGMIDTEEPRIDDISLGGCFVNTRAHAQINETINLEVRFPSGEWLPLPGSVISYQPGVGFGLSFTSLSDREISALQALT